VVDVAKAAMAENPTKTWASQLLGMAYFWNGEYKLFTQVLRNLVTEERGIRLLSIGFFTHAIEGTCQETGVALLNMQLDEDATDRLAWRQLGEIYARKGDHSAVCQTFEKAVHKNENHSWAYDALGTAYFEAGECEKARETYERALEKLPNKESLWEGLAKCYWAMGDKGGGLNACQRAVKENPTEQWSWMALYHAYIESGNEGTNTFIELEQALENQGDYKEIIETFENAVIQDSNLTIDDNERAVETLYSVIDRYEFESRSV
jgi:tetratricopeptide (TPR) repeat protein